MNGGVLYCCCLILLGFAQPISNVPNGKATVVSGHVLYRDGSPVKDAEVEVHFFAPVGGILPPPVRTDEKGYFSISPPPLGEGVVTASKVSEGYPNAAMALYGREGYTSLRRIAVKEGVVFDEIDLRFGEPDAVIEWAIQSAVTREPVKKVRYTISWLDDPDMFCSSSVSENGRFIFVIPKHPVFVKITAPGFADWSYRDEHTGRQALLMRPGTRDQRVVLLSRLQ
jgi:hypothetical protein